MSQPRQSTADTALSKHFHIIGQGISFSKSPAIHTAGFRHYGLPHTYDIMEPADINNVASLVEDELFGGASVTMPHKLNVHIFCEQQTDHARHIGAINTLIVKSDELGQKHIVGDNTDWSGLYSIISAKTKSWADRPRCGLVIGAGGASRAALYALYQSSVSEIFMVNRTRANAEKVARDFASIFHVKIVPSLRDLDLQPDIIIGTIPADVTSKNDFAMLFEDSNRNGLCIDMAYKPQRMPLLVAAEGCPGWDRITGLEVLLYQAFDQFELWTGLKAPQDDMAEAIGISHV